MCKGNSLSTLRFPRIQNRCTVTVFGTVSLIFLAGCPSEPTKVDTAIKTAFRGQELEVIAPASLNLPVYWEVLRQEWSSQTGATMKFGELGREEPASVLKGQIPSGGRLVFFPLNQLCEIEHELSPLPVGDGQLDWKDVFKGLRDRVLTRERQPTSFPVSVPVLVCYYRQDLLRAARRSPPETWDDYHELVSSIETWAPGMVAVEPLSPEFRATTFFAKTLAFCKHPENYSVWFDIDTGAPTLNSPGFVTGLEAALQTWKKLPPEVLTYSPRDCREQILRGKAAIALTWEPMSAELLSRSQNDDSSQIQRVDGIELGISRLPGTRRVYNRNSKKWDNIPTGTVHAPALCGQSGLAVGFQKPPSGASESAGANFIVSVTSSPMFDEAFSALPKGPGCESQLTFAPAWFGPDLATEESSQYVDAVSSSLRDPQLVYELPLSGRDDFRRAAATALEPLLRGEADVESTLTSMQKLFEVIVEKIGPETIRESYRRGLGMSPAVKK